MWELNRPFNCMSSIMTMNVARRYKHVRNILGARLFCDLNIKVTESKSINW